MKLALLALCIAAPEPLDHADRPAARVALSFTAYVPETSTLRIEAAWLSLQDVQLRPSSACTATTTKTLVAGPLAVDLVRGASADTARVEATRYCAVQLRPQRSRGKLQELKGVSVVLRGKRADGVRFVLRSRVETIVRLRARDLDGITVGESGAAWIVAADLGRWMHGVNLAEADLVDGGRDREIRIDDKHNPELLAAFEANLAAGLALYLDANGNRVLDGDERTPIAAPR